ncbi:BamA/TamA family outer membrane protein [Candidatus Cardinium hertigii]|uniref:BamA/TamA family outer membrane protein n=1 Tax=Candidatus Cardinium hertigii TaxID=247481 RepID=UPI0013A56450|nr:BamA/TamA family outer membrane protein [Candidatus Cardinium hertigii]
MKKELIVGVNSFHKKELKKHAVRPLHTTFLGMPIRKWLYQLGAKQFAPDKIKKDIHAIRNLYAAKLSHTVEEKEREKLRTKRDKLIHAKEMVYAQGNWFMRKGEKPVEYDPVYVKENEKIFLNYFYSIGYLDAEVSSQTVTQKGKVVVTYYIKQNKLYRITSIEVQTPHKEIQTLLSQRIQTSFLQKGHSYQYQNLVKEQERIITLLSNEGYFACNEKHVSFEAKVFHEDATISLTILIEGEKGDIPHLKKTKVATVVVDFENQYDRENKTAMRTVWFQNVECRMRSHTYALPALMRKIAIRPGDWYSKRKIIETYERLHDLALFESITILPKLEADQLVVHIQVRPYEKVKCQLELGGECINLNVKRLRPTIKIAPTIRPLWGGLGMACVEASMGLGERQENTQESTQAYPFYRYMFYQLRYKFMTSRFVCYLPEHIIRLLEDFSPKTTLDIGYSFFRRPVCNRHKIEATFAYGWCSRSKHINFQMVPCGIIADFKNKKSEHTEVNRGDPWQTPPAFLTTMEAVCKIEPLPSVYVPLLSNYKKWMLSLGIEGGGLYEHIFPIIKNFLSNKFQYCQYVKFDVTYRHAWQLTQDTTFVCQTKWGAIMACGATAKEAKEVYAEKQYTVGGHGSVRAWDTQMIGPGRYEVNKKNHPQKGDLLLLGNIELRQKWIGYLEGALFLDIGNTWKLASHALPIMKFNWNKFYKELAVGGGVGLRLNFYDTFVLCGDIAIPFCNPSGNKNANGPPFNFNLSIDYPF